MNFYGDNFRWFVGVVLSTNDPFARGRVKIKIHGVHSDNPNDIANDEYPWAECMLPSTEGGVSGIGKIPQIKNSAMVFGIFLDGTTSQSPLILGSLTHNEGPTESQIKAKVEARNRGDFIPGNFGPDGFVFPEQLRQQLSSTDAIDAKRLLIMQLLMAQTRDGRPRFKPFQAAAIVGNLEAESSTFDPEDENEIGAFGIAQWYKSRRKKLFLFAANNGLQANTIEAQVKYLVHELYGSPTRNDGGSSHRSVYDNLIKSTTNFGFPNNGQFKKVNATYIFLEEYENPGGHSDKIRQREEYSIRALQQYYNSLETASASNE